jgi:outer membrane protein assembly factor BamE (lipoprotein component of BamABCDE complex)
MIPKISPGFSLILAATLVLASGCAGTDFKRPSSTELTIGKSTTDDIVRVMGPAKTLGEVTKNSCQIRQCTYVYATAVGTPLYSGVTPVRAMTFSTFNEVLVGQQFLSSFKEDGTDFDDSKIAQIVKGRTTKDEVIALLGRPSGEAVYPLVKNQGDTAILYTYVQTKRSGLVAIKVFQKALSVSFGPDRVATEVEFASSGDR